MDPDKRLEEIRELVKRLQKGADNEQEGGSAVNDGDELAWKFAELDAWLSRGSSMPRSWDTRLPLDEAALKGG